MDISNPNTTNATDNKTSKEMIQLLENSMMENIKLLEEIRQELD